MAKSPFDMFPVDFRPLLDKLPTPDKHGELSLEGHWWRKDRDQIAEAIAVLGLRLKNTKLGIDRARKAGDLAAVRAGAVASLVLVQEALMPIVGVDQTWSICQAIDVLETAGHGKLHQLTALRMDDLHTRQDAPDRLILQSLAAAFLDFFNDRIDGLTQAELGKKIVCAMAAGGFRVGSPQTPRPPAVRTLQHWRNQCLPGSRSNPPDVRMRGMFASFRCQIEGNQNGRPLNEYLNLGLSELEVHARDRQTTLPK